MEITKEKFIILELIPTNLKNKNGMIIQLSALKIDCLNLLERFDYRIKDEYLPLEQFKEIIINDYTKNLVAEKFIKNTENKDVSYAQAYIDAGIKANVSPYHLASRTLQEVGRTGTSGSVNGSSGFYNYYNIGANSGSDPVANALNFAATTDSKYMLPWNTPYKAIVGGAIWISKGYIDKGQDTLYYQKFNVINQVWTHQYMTNIMAPYQESDIVHKSYKNMDIIDLSHVFVIPYYKNMPDNACELPKASNGSPNNWLSSLVVEGYEKAISFDGNKTSGYSFEVPESVSSVNITAKAVSSKAKVEGTGKVNLNAGKNSIKIVVTAENGNTKTYTLDITRNATNVVPLTGISLDKTELTMFNGETKQLTVKYNPTNTTDSKDVKWTTSDKSVATVDDNGKVVAIGKGTATITAKVGTYTATCKVTISNDCIFGANHIYKSEITTPATHLTTGVETFTCSCGDTYTKTIEKLAEHKYDFVVTPPTCIEQGYTTYTCECGDAYVDDYVEAKGHTLTWHTLSVTTCNTDGVMHGYCDDCSYFEVKTTPMTGHSDNDGDGKCDTCPEILDPTLNCDCNCHKSGILNFFFKFALFFQKLFGSNKYCSCGIAHY